ncbi:MAG: bifunctional adenosylcobinamide kinase/adenosylcobinamide-phosphate guanylyltransferase [Firmicutes bacterium]|nr:bifunctional adenosylcobinamide kinase/adenosylcobinamide-phosphate guanylyltransferase [Bacillota bacterium]
MTAPQGGPQGGAASLVFITGGVRSGKSALGEKMAAACGREVLYIATARPLDPEMARRIENHRRRRPPAWRVVEAPFHLAPALRDSVKEGGAPSVVLLDCLTIFVSNILLGGLWLGVDDREMDERAFAELERRGDECVERVREFIAETRASSLNAVIVGNEVGLGVVPEYPAARVYRDVAGRVNQLVATSADEVWAVWSGIPVRIKPAPVVSGWPPP